MKIFKKDKQEELENNFPPLLYDKVIDIYMIDDIPCILGEKHSYVMIKIGCYYTKESFIQSIKHLEPHMNINHRLKLYDKLDELRKENY